MSKEPTVFRLHSSVDPVKPMATKLPLWRRIFPRSKTGMNLAKLRMQRARTQA